MGDSESNVTTTSAAAAVRQQATRSESKNGRSWLVLTGAVLGFGAAIVHIVAAPTHAGQSAALGVALALGGALQASLAAAMVVNPSRRMVLFNLMVEAAAAAVWWLVHTVGLPLGGGWWRPEAISVPDLAAPVAELLAALALAGALLRSRARPQRTVAMVAATTPAVLLAVVLTGIGGAASADETWLPLSAAVQAPAGKTTTLMYCDPGGAPLAMDVSEPAAGMSRPAPAALYVHGGGGVLGDRQAAGPGAAVANQDGALFGRMRMQLLGRASLPPSTTGCSLSTPGHSRLRTPSVLSGSSEHTPLLWALTLTASVCGAAVRAVT
jgi:hypothetical protein